MYAAKVQLLYAGTQSCCTACGMRVQGPALCNVHHIYWLHHLPSTLPKVIRCAATSTPPCAAARSPLSLPAPQLTQVCCPCLA